MWSTDCGCGQNIPNDIEPERGQVCENASPQRAFRLSWSCRHGEQVVDVLDEAVARSKLTDDSPHLAPQNSLGMVEAVALACRAGALAGEASGDKVDAAREVVSAWPNSFPVGPALLAWPSFAIPCGFGSSFTRPSSDGRTAAPALGL